MCGEYLRKFQKVNVVEALRDVGNKYKNRGTQVGTLNLPSKINHGAMKVQKGVI